MTGPTTHSEIGASGMSRWAKCPGSVRLSRGMPNITSDEAEDGTYAHSVAEEILNNKLIDCEDPEIIDNVMVYVEHARELQKGCSSYGVEEKFDLSSIYPGLFGTADFWAFNASTGVLDVVDYKHGQGISVEVENNPQLQYYALGALLKLKLKPTQIRMTIVQPRAWHPDGPIRSWTIPVTQLIDFTADLIDYAEETQKEDAAIVPGDHCRFCAAAALCPTLTELSVTNTQVEIGPKYEPAVLGEMLSKVPAIKAWIKNLESFAFHEANKGREIPGFKLVPKKTHRKWKDIEDLDTKLLLECGLSYEDVWNKKMRTPAQVEDKLDKEGKELLKQFTFKPEGGVTLAPLEDKRKKAKSSVETDFTVIE